MATVISGDVTTLRSALSGDVLVQGDEGYDEARTAWNAEIDRYPAVITRCADAADVSAAIGFAKAHGLEISVRGGAHGTGGNSIVDGGLEIDLSRIRAVSVDPVRRTCRVGGGATLAERDTATQVHGLATTAGLIGHTGVGGLSLGGGMGWLTRKHGLAVDNIIGAEIVTADGQVRQVSEHVEPDLFWAIRGGGGNFGVVTELEFKLHPVGPVVAFGLFFWTLDETAAVLRFGNELVQGLPRDLNVIMAAVNAPPAPFVPDHLQGVAGIVMLVTGFDADEEHAEVVGRIRSQLPPRFDLVEPMPYVQLQQLFDEANAFGFLAYDKAIYVEDLDDAVINTFVDHLPKKSSPKSAVFIYRLDGAYSDVEDDATAFGGGRSPRYSVFLVELADNPEMQKADRAWVQGFWDALLPHSLGIGSYVNGEYEHVEERVRASYGPKYERLSRIKATYDPDNVFHLNANIRPAAQPPAQRPATP